MYHRTKTYIAGDWTGDQDAIEKIREWNDSYFYSMLNFVDVHEFVQAKDTSLPCSIKRSLYERMRMCKTFILIVGKHTKSLRKGSCHLCGCFHSYGGGFLWHCEKERQISFKSYVEYECEQAIKQELNIIVLYNSASIQRDLCPECVRETGRHVAMLFQKNGKLYWNYSDVRDALLEIH